MCSPAPILLFLWCGSVLMSLPVGVAFHNLLFVLCVVRYCLRSHKYVKLFINKCVTYTYLCLLSFSDIKT